MKILLTAGPTREYLDDVRFLSNASSGRMGVAIASAALAAGHQVVLVCGPVDVAPPPGCELHRVEGTREMFDVCLEQFPACDGVIAAAAVCDYGPRDRHAGKLAKTGQPLTLELIELPDILAELGRRKEHRWSVGFALESQDPHARANEKLRRKNCNAIILNRPSAIGAEQNSVELIDGTGAIAATWSGEKRDVAGELIGWIDEHLGPLLPLAD